MGDREARYALHSRRGRLEPASCGHTGGARAGEVGGERARHALSQPAADRATLCSAERSQSMRLAVLGSLLLFALPATPAEAKPRHHCNPPGAKSVTRDEHGRVYHVVGPDPDEYGDTDRYYACLYRSGRTRR